MSFYATLQGEVVFPSQEAYAQVINRLTLGGWLDSEGYLLDESEERVTEEGYPDANPATRTLRLPYWVYRNISCISFFDDPGTTGRIIGTSTDGCFIGWVEGPKGEEIPETELTAFADGDPPDIDLDFEGYLEWQQAAENNFHDKYA